VVSTSAQSIVAPESNRVTLTQHLGTIQAVLVVLSRLDVPTLVSSDTVLCMRNTIANVQASYE